MEWFAKRESRSTCTYSHLDVIEYIKSARNFDNICAAGVLQFCYPEHGTYSNQKDDNISLSKYVSRAIIKINKNIRKTNWLRAFVLTSFRVIPSESIVEERASWTSRPVFFVLFFWFSITSLSRSSLTLIFFRFFFSFLSLAFHSCVLYNPLFFCSIHKETYEYRNPIDFHKYESIHWRLPSFHEFFASYLRLSSLFRIFLSERVGTAHTNCTCTHTMLAQLIHANKREVTAEKGGRRRKGRTFDGCARFFMSTLRHYRTILSFSQVLSRDEFMYQHVAPQEK